MGKRPRVLLNIHSAQDPGFPRSQVAAEAETSRSDPLASSLSSCRKAAACAQRRVKDHSPSFPPTTLVLTPCLRIRGTTAPQPRGCVRMGQAPRPCSILSTGFPKGLELDRERDLYEQTSDTVHCGAGWGTFRTHSTRSRFRWLRNIWMYKPTPTLSAGVHAIFLHFHLRRTLSCLPTASPG